MLYTILFIIFRAVDHFKFALLKWSHFNLKQIPDLIIIITMILQCRLIRCTETRSHIFARNFNKRTFSCLIHLHICTRPQFSDETANFPHLCSTKGFRQSKILFPFLRARFNLNQTYNYVTTYPQRSRNIFLLILYQNGTSIYIYIYIVLPLILSCNVWLLKVKERARELFIFERKSCRGLNTSVTGCAHRSSCERSCQWLWDSVSV